MTPDERLINILLSLKLGPLTSLFGIVKGRCECGMPPAPKHKQGKHPRLPGFQTTNSTTDEKTIRRWFQQYPFGNFGVITGVVTVVLDLDIRPGKDGVAELKRLELEAGQIVPPTVTVISGSGGVHHYFKVPADLGNLQKPKGTKGIDFLRSRLPAVLPGSLHENGQYYRFASGLSPADIELAELPEWLLEQMQKPAAISRMPTGVSGDIDGLFTELLKMGPPPGSMPPGRLRPDDFVKRKMKSVPMRMYPNDRSHSDSHWAWTLARNCCHHWHQYLRIWKDSPIRKLPDTKCGRPDYEASILEKAFLDQKQQWKSKLAKRLIAESANPALMKRIRKEEATHREVPRSEITKAVLQLHSRQPSLKDGEIAIKLNAAGKLAKLVTRNNVKRIRQSYPQYW